MKRILSIMLILLMIFALAGCVSKPVTSAGEFAGSVKSETLASEVNTDNVVVATSEPTSTAINIVDMSGIKYVIQTVNVGKGPGTEYEKIGELVMNQEVDVTGKTDNGWFRITYNGTEGYVSEKYLADTKVVYPTPVPSAEESVSSALIMVKLESAMYAAGYKKPVDVWPKDEAEELLNEFGPTGGMSWEIYTIDNTSEEKAEEYIAEIVSAMGVNGNNMFYLEYSGINSDNKWCDVKVYYGVLR